MTSSHLQGMAHLLVQNKQLNHETALLYQHAAQNSDLSLLQYLVDNNIIPAKILATSIANHFEIPLFELDDFNITSIPSEFIHETFMQRYRIVPLFLQRNQLYVAMDDPGQHEALKEMQFYTGHSVIPFVVETPKLTRLIHQLLHHNENLDLADLITESHNNIPTDNSSNDQPVVKFVRRILQEAIEQNASDIHFEPYEQTYRIRYRQDGLLITVATPPVNLSGRIAARIKIIANLDISERRIPQDGRFRMKILSEKTIDFRVSTCPMIGGEKIVVRILDITSNQPDINYLCLSIRQKHQLLQAISRPQGMILVTGPTGSGKTLTLYSILNALNTEEKNISTIEDPVEINIQGINQVNINLKTGLTFAHALRACLRQDPDVIMVGEIRDQETADIAVKAAQTGHLVLSTLHTNSATETLTRLVNMGIPSFNVSSSINLIIAQRLVRRLCKHCKIIRDDLSAYTLIELELSEVDDTLLKSFKAQGCHQCSKGYRGRIALFEILPISKPISQMILAGKSAPELRNQAQAEGILTMLQDGLEKIRMGLTSLEELSRVLVN